MAEQVLEKVNQQRKIFDDPLSNTLMQARTFKIVTNKLLRDTAVERRLIETNRENIMYMMLAAGGVLMLYALMQ